MSYNNIITGSMLAAIARARSKEDDEPTDTSDDDTEDAPVPS